MLHAEYFNDYIFQMTLMVKLVLEELKLNLGENYILRYFQHISAEMFKFCDYIIKQEKEKTTCIR